MYSLVATFYAFASLLSNFASISHACPHVVLARFVEK